jgi:NDP-sugar pyrophosphorylase family protein
VKAFTGHWTGPARKYLNQLPIQTVMTTKLTAVFLTAGTSSRFGGKMKFLARIGPNNETLLELSLNQTVFAGFDNFVFVASEKSLNPLKDEFGTEFKNIPISYCIQQTPEYREKPFGTAHALLSAKESVKSAFIVLNSDDIYGKNTLKSIIDYLKENKGHYCLAGYKAKNVLSKEKSNKGYIKTDDNLFLKSIEEKLGVTIYDIPSKFKEDSFLSLNLFGLQPAFLDYLEEVFKQFIEDKHPSKEFMLPNEVGDFMKKNLIKVKVIPTDDTQISLTFPEDEEVVRNKLKWQPS